MAPFSTVARAFVLFSVFFHASSAERTRCANEPSQDAVEAAEAHFQANKIVPTSSFAAAAEDITLNIYWHVIYETENFEGGYLPQEQIDAAIDAMNDYYADSPYTWALADTIRTQSQEWFDNVNIDNSWEAAMKQTLRLGGPDDLNVYTVNFTTDPAILGWATFPWDYATAPLNDGIVMYYDTLPGGNNINNANTMAHEAGHWLGLYHVFQGGCGATGDLVDDTPAQQRAVFECNFESDTCPTLPGLDPITNLMGYAHLCRAELTPGQIQRTREQIVTYRGVSV
ncbi:metalloprotease [Mycena crocata]|nr:metalloprotease [Mycena crocata]